MVKYMIFSHGGSDMIKAEICERIISLEHYLMIPLRFKYLPFCVEKRRINIDLLKQYKLEEFANLREYKYGETVSVLLEVVDLISLFL